MSTLGNTSDNAGPSFTMASFLTSHGNFLPFHQPPYQMYMPPMMDNLLNPNRHLPYRYDHQKFMSPPRLSPHSTTGSENSENEQNSPNSSNKPSTRPFKLYSKDPISMSFGIPTEAILNKNSEEAYAEFREKMLNQSQNTTNLNKNMRRSIHTQNNDPEYLERRKKNNEAAKRSRDARKAKEDEIAIRCAFLEKENLHLKIKIATLENERDRLHSMIYR